MACEFKPAPDIVPILPLRNCFMDRPIVSQRQPVTPPWFWLGLATLWLIALSLRFWGLERFDTLVFDEVYFAQFGHNYLTHTSFFDAHPPLGKYLIAVGIWLKGYHPWGYRWMNALVGSLVPVIVTVLGVQLTRRYSFALLAGALAVLDGLLLVESRYGLINIYLLAFGLLAQWLTLLSCNFKGWRHWAILTLAALSFGAAVAVKWTGLGFLLGLYLFWILGNLSRLGQKRSSPSPDLPLAKLLRLSFGLKLFIFIPVVGAVLYSLAWIPHLLQNSQFGFIEVHQQMFGYHRRVGNGPSIHPYCSSLLTWPFMLRPVSYFYQLASSLQEAMPMTGPPLTFEKAKYIYSVYAMGNPPLWWSATVAIAITIGMTLGCTVPKFRQWLSSKRRSLALNPTEKYLPLYFTTGYAAHLLPWLSISRCAFLYHYMPAYLFSSLSLAWLLIKGLRTPWKQRLPRTWIILAACTLNVLLSAGVLVAVLPELTPAFWQQPPWTLALVLSLCLLSIVSAGILFVELWQNPRLLALVILALSILGFLFWLPFYLGLPISPREWQWRIWFPSWI
jgi:dolichyl-phosphate-mannose-protein mannosyltransferase